MKKFLFLASTILFFAGCSSDDDVSPVVNPETKNPVATADAVSTSENEELKIAKDFLLENDEIVDLSRISDFDSETTEGGEVVDNRDGTFSYFPPEDFQGEDSFSYDLCVPGSQDRCASAVVTIAVGDAGSPVAEDDSYETNEGSELRINNHLSNDNLIDNAELSSVNSDDTAGTVVLEDDGSITYTPAEGFSGEDTFTYTICDNDEEAECSTATVTINVIDEGSPVAADDTVVIDMNTSEFTINSLLNNDEVVDDAEITSIDDTDTRGALTLNDDGSISYIPEVGYLGEDTFTYTLCDDDEEATCSTATVTLTLVDPVSFNIPSELEDYYDGLAISQNEDLNYKVISELTNEMHTTILSYGQRHDYLYNADEDLENEDNVILIYSGESRYWEEYSSGNNSYSPQTFNTEHVFPQSLLVSEIARTDLHHLRAADADVNELRSNNPYTEGGGDYDSVDDTAFFPGDEWKGDVARMILYLNVRYNEDISKVGNLELFLKWNREDPVSAFEIQRNNVIEGAQGNRNPFIDNPYLVTLIWGGDAAENTWE
ncbi:MULTISPECIES: Ig-like domain-containing protein [Salegentibacter]|jgi:endonuclease I|uniref:Endonuclease I n=1 Tax=Salegentibacter agarivorans TaxID=345907 RepID=A0A1I2MCB0_9FLAO|nr:MULTISPECIES: Ig-like domain-containing protein [Salegentibacter]APS37942.1 endonuclease I [Salegentibacter sp. T436]SFF87036.1 Endonuclease I [Salegentibacter agarivorans]